MGASLVAQLIRLRSLARAAGRGIISCPTLLREHGDAGRSAWASIVLQALAARFFL